MKSASKRKRKKQESLAALVARQRSAPAVWLALCDMADERGSRVVTPTREQLRQLTGLSEKTISADAHGPRAGRAGSIARTSRS
jgi:hypothetical protein